MTPVQCNHADLISEVTTGLLGANRMCQDDWTEKYIFILYFKLKANTVSALCLYHLT